MMDATEAFQCLGPSLSRITSNLTSELMPAEETRMVLTNSVVVHGTHLSTRDLESARSLAMKWLCNEETAAMNKYQRKARANLYLIGRIILKRCIMDYSMQRGTEISAKRISVVDDESGRPDVTVDPSAFEGPVFVSLSHKHEIFIGVCSSTPIGIDIEAITTNHPGLSHRTLVDVNADKDLREHIQDTIGTGELAAVQNTLWCVREAAFKSFPPDPRSSPLNVKISLVNKQIVPHIGEGNLRVSRSTYISRQNDYVCCIAY